MEGICKGHVIEKVLYRKEMSLNLGHYLHLRQLVILLLNINKPIKGEMALMVINNDI